MKYEELMPILIKKIKSVCAVNKAVYRNKYVNKNETNLKYKEDIDFFSEPAKKLLKSSKFSLSNCNTIAMHLLDFLCETEIHHDHYDHYHNKSIDMKSISPKWANDLIQELSNDIMSAWQEEHKK